LESIVREDIGSADKINSYGIMALLYWRLGQREAAQSAVEAGLHWIARSSPTGFGMVHGYSDVAEVCLALWEAEDGLGVRDWGLGSQNPKSNALQAFKALHRYARAFPIGQPRAWLWQGWYEWLSGRRGRAKAAWRKSRAAAERLAMPYDQALVLSEMGRHLPAADPDRQIYLIRAAEIFNQLQAAYDLRRLG
jgi:hypothetical protein